MQQLSARGLADHLQQRVARGGDRLSRARSASMNSPDVFLRKSSRLDEHAQVDEPVPQRANAVENCR